MYDGEQPRQDRTVPLNPSARRKALFAEVPTLTVDPPWHDVFGLRLHPLQVGKERRRSLLEKLAEGGRVQLAEPESVDCDFLPRAAPIGDPHSWHVRSVERAARCLAHRGNPEPAVQFRRLK